MNENVDTNSKLDLSDDDLDAVTGGTNHGGFIDNILKILKVKDTDDDNSKG